MARTAFDLSLLQRWNDAPLVLALSGGGDSAALLHQMADAGLSFHAIVVDHALREGSAEDAHRALGFARARGVGAEIVTLAWPDGASVGQQAARRARYAALCAAARRIGARAIVTAHTADDQAETVLMRAGAGSGWRGLAGMAARAAAPVWPEGRGLALLRPVLGVRRAALRAQLRDREAAWIEDPANANPRFERVRVRARLAALEQAGFDPMRLVETAAHLRALADAVDGEAREIAARARLGEGVIEMEARDWTGSEAARRRALGVLIAAAAGAEALPEADAVARIEPQLGDESFRGATLGGAALKRVRGAIVFRRDPGALLGRAGLKPSPPCPLPAQFETIWDGRLALAPREAGWSVAAGAGEAPELRRAEERLTLAEAVRSGRVEAAWLTLAAIEHRLPGADSAQFAGAEG